jgi:hypothetical protein
MPLLTKLKKSRRELQAPADIDQYQSLPGSHGSIYAGGLRVQDDPWYRLCSKAEENPNFQNVIESLRLGELSRNAGREFLAMDGPLYHDTRAQSIVTATQANVTGTTTAKMMHPAAFTNLPAMYFSVAKKVRQSVAVSVTHGATVGNVTPVIYYGSTDAGTTLLATGVAQAGVNAGVGPYIIQVYGISRGGAVVSAVPMVAYGIFQASSAVVLPANMVPGIPTAAIAPVNIDATAALGFTIQALNSGANGSVYATHDITFEALN